jgi:hypothetical protein
MDSNRAVIDAATEIVREAHLAAVIETEIVAQLDPVIAAQLEPVITVLIDHVAALEARVDVLEQLANQNGWGAWWR